VPIAVHLFQSRARRRRVPASQSLDVPARPHRAFALFVVVEQGAVDDEGDGDVVAETGADAAARASVGTFRARGRRGYLATTPRTISDVRDARARDGGRRGRRRGHPARARRIRADEDDATTRRRGV